MVVERRVGLHVSKPGLGEGPTRIHDPSHDHCPRLNCGCLHLAVFHHILEHFQIPRANVRGPDSQSHVRSSLTPVARWQHTKSERRFGSQTLRQPPGNQVVLFPAGQLQRKDGRLTTWTFQLHVSLSTSLRAVTLALPTTNNSKHDSNNNGTTIAMGLGAARCRCRRLSGASV